MKNMMKTNYIKIFLLLLVFSFSSCETTDLDVQTDPIGIDPSQGDVDTFLNSIQLGLANFITGLEGSNFDGASEFGMEAVRMLHGFGPSYRELNDPADFNQMWSDAYSNVLIDVKTMTALAEQQGQTTHIAMGQVFEAYIMMTLVDFFGDVPYSEALLGLENFNPRPDSGASIYAAADQLLIDAIANFNIAPTVSEPQNDLYYNGDKDKWIRLANTLRLKLYLQTRLANDGGFGASTSTAEINALIAGGDLILSSSDDFVFRWTTNPSAPDSRHPYFEKNYGGAGPDSDFIMANYYMDLLANNYSLPDPRIRYYFYRQEGDFSESNVQTKPCSSQPFPAWYGPDDIFCDVPDTNGMNGYWGWDHLNSDGIPPHDAFVTMFGVYPVGGPFDDDSFDSVSGSSAINEGFRGAGITPIMTSAYTHFMLAEAALTLGTSGDALTYLEDGIRNSISTVTTFGKPISDAIIVIPDDPNTPNIDETQTATDIFAPSSTDIQDYIDDVVAEYNGGGNDVKLKVIVEQYFIALWTNGIEAYNTYRRTGQPSDIQPALDLADPGVFVRSMWYPSAAADNNSNITQKIDVSSPVFWDTNPEGLVD